MTLKEIELKQLCLLVRHAAKVGRENLKDHERTILEHLESKYGADDSKLSFSQFCALTM